MIHKFSFYSVLFTLTVILFTSCKKDELVNPIGIIDNNNSNVELTYIKYGSSVKLYAGQTHEAGTVEINVLNDNLVVTFNTNNGFELLETHLFVGSSLSQMPQTNSGNPKIGNFPYVASGLNGLTSYSFTIPMSTFGSEPAICDQVFYVAAHASVRKQLGTGIYQYETAWGDGLRLTQRGNWAMYFSFQFGCKEDNPPPIVDCETAFGYGQNTFVSYGLTNNRWGWVIEVQEPGTYSTPIYAAAGNNIISNGYFVGNLNYTYNGSVLTVNYSMFNGFKLDETHIYASNQIPTTIAPGQYGNIHDLDAASSDSFTISNLNGKVYIIAHAVVCSSQFN